MTSTSPTSPKRTSRGAITAWAMWDFGSAAFNAVLVTFIFSVYLTDVVGSDVSGASAWYGAGMAIAGVAIALIAPVMGQRADISGTRKRSVVVWTAVTVALMALLVIVGDDTHWFFIGVAILALASIAFEFAEVNYFAMLPQLSTKANVGTISGIGWGAGYLGGIVLLLLCFIVFVSSNGDGTAGLFGISTDDGLNIRLVAVFAALWFALSAIPLARKIPEISQRPGAKKESFPDSYRRLFRLLKNMWRHDRNTLSFLVASAVFRDGLSGVFTFGAILAVQVYGFSSSEVLIFGVAANVVAAAGAFIGGYLDDILGPKNIILGCLGLMIISAGFLFFLDGQVIFWIFGLALCTFVGPAQSASRSFMARLTTKENSGEIFGLYATTGRAVSWLAPASFAAFVAISGEDRFSILAIALVLIVGGVLLVPAKSGASRSKNSVVQ